MQITWRMDNSGVRECGRSSAWLRLPHLPFLRRGYSASSESEWEDRHESGRCRRTIATIAASARCRSRDIVGFPLSPSGASIQWGPPSYEYLAEANPVLHANSEINPWTHRGLLRPLFFGGMIDSGPLPFARPGAALRALACPLSCPLTLGAMAWMDYVSLEIKENARCRKGIGRP